MSRRLVVVATLLAVSLAPSVRGAPREASERVYVTIADAKGQPVRGLTAVDFFVQLDGAPQELLSVAPATEPASVVLLTDRLGQTADYRPSDLRKAFQSFVGVLRSGHPSTKFALTTFDAIVVQLTKFTAPAADLDRALDRLPSTAMDAPLSDALGDACRTMVLAPTERRAIFLVYGSYRPDRGDGRIDVTAERCRLSGASLWAIEARASDGRNYRNPARERVVDDTSRLSGGMTEYVATATALDAVATVMAGLISAQYVVTFAPGGGTAASRLTVGVKRSDVFVLAPPFVTPDDLLDRIAEILASATRAVLG